MVWWELPVSIRKFCLGAGSMLSSSNPTMQAGGKRSCLNLMKTHLVVVHLDAGAILVLVVSMVFQFFFQPYRSRWTNVLEFLTLFCNVWVLPPGIVFKASVTLQANSNLQNAFTVSPTPLLHSSCLAHISPPHICTSVCSTLDEPTSQKLML